MLKPSGSHLLLTCCTAVEPLTVVLPLCNAAAKTLISLYTSELLPTTCRSSITGIYRLVSRLGSISAPFLLMLGAHLGSVGGHDNVSHTAHAMQGLSN